ncbi:hypothetical protein CMU09_17990 [Elizabethkingia anophelis]|nr:hypothetical protein [Elizabethkingia anophelis]MDV3570088.1 hypothetical protein [Elizabethkingia anophelis]MDV3593807.1 hypothetical protein [Elizabethkingia anophelis]MDV3779130.1 hypothetical protein [Elizabethkingia anophelis]MDV3813940.1 hypothetical protein [Elizabethkingia anophelis]
MTYYRSGELETDKISAKDDIEAFDKGYLKLRAMEKTVETLEKRGVKSVLGDVPTTFSLYDKDGQYIYIDSYKKDSLYNKWQKIK